MAGFIAGEQAIVGVIRFVPLEVLSIPELIALEIASTPFPWTISMLEGSLTAKPDCQKICLDDETIGYLVVQRIFDEADILNLVIFKSFQARGHGYAVICKLQEDLAKLGVKKLFLEVRRSNHAAHALYAKTGFAQLGTREAYYRARSPAERAEDALILSCDLKGVRFKS